MKLYIQKYFVLFLAILLFAFNGNAISAEVKVAKPQVQKITLMDEKGESFKVSLISYKNHLDELEVRLEAASIPRFAAHINPLLGFGRDTDGNGKIDTWFFVTKKGMSPIVEEGKIALGQDVLGKILIKEYRTTFGMYVSSATTSLLSYVFIAGSASQDAQEEYYRDWMDLEEARLNFEADFNSLGSSYTRAQYFYHQELLSIGYKEIANRMESYGKRTYWGLALADLGLWITGGVVLEWGGKILARIGATVSNITFVNFVKDAFFSFLEKQKALVESRLSILKGRINTARINAGMKTAEKEVFLALTVATWKQALKNTIKAQKIKQRMRITLKTAMKWPGSVVSGVKKEWRYIALNSTIQIGAEAAVRYDDIYDPNPFVMSKNLLTNPDVLENVGFMAADTVLMTGVSKSFKTTKAKFIASGAVALTNSSIMNFAIKEDADIKRVAFDTAWESVAGNTQVQIDLAALEYFEKMALRKGNPRIKLLGYLVVIIDQGIGYGSYSKLSSMLEKEQNESIMLVPVLGER